MEHRNLKTEDEGKATGKTEPDGTKGGMREHGGVVRLKVSGGDKGGAKVNNALTGRGDSIGSEAGDRARVSSGLGGAGGLKNRSRSAQFSAGDEGSLRKG